MLHASKEIKDKLSFLVQTYTDNISQYTDKEYNETLTRRDFIDKFFTLLGWDVSNEKGLNQYKREVIHEATVVVEEDGEKRKKKPDYLFKLGSQKLFYLEAKAPHVNINASDSPAFQLRRYGWTGNLPISILTNFNDLSIYDCTIQPEEITSDTEDYFLKARVKHYTYDEYVEKFDEIYSIISREAVICGSFKKFTDQLENVAQKEPFNKYFLKQIMKWRLNLGQDILNNNNITDNNLLNIYVQKLLNRILFLRICEDRGYEDYKTLKSVKTYEELRSLFIVADNKYDSGLFELIDDENLSISDQLIIDIFCDLYYPNSPYEFSVVEPELIGQIYEIFLSQSLIIKDGKIDVINKPEIIDELGAVTTPKNITDFIVKHTLDNIYANIDVEEADKKKIADICCGAGNFLLSAYEYILDYYTSYYIEHNNNDDKLIYEPVTDTYRLSYPDKVKILTQNIYGVDIDPLAVEVAKFSLMIKLLEDTSSEETESYAKINKIPILPNLNSNIKNGNSLIDFSYIELDSSNATDISKTLQINPFDWNESFNGIKFDAIIGNPPYIRVQKLAKYSPLEYDYYQSKLSPYTTIKNGAPDKYALFVERSISLISNDGYVGYIIPNKFIVDKTGKALRELLAKDNSVKELIHFRDRQIFKKVSTYVCIIVLSKKHQDAIERGLISNWEDFFYNGNVSYKTFNYSQFSNESWGILGSTKDIKIYTDTDKISKLSDVADFILGVQTSNNDVYIISPKAEDDDYVYFQKGDKEYKVEKCILRTGLYQSQLSSYETVSHNSYFIFPYQNIDNQIKVIPEKVMKKDFPCVYQYLSDYKSELAKRKINKKNPVWYEYGRAQSLGKFESGERIIWNVMHSSSSEPGYTYDNIPLIYTGGGHAGPYWGLQLKKDIPESIYYILALLNNDELETRLEELYKIDFRGGYYSRNDETMKDLPIYRIDFTNTEEKNIHDKIVSDVTEIIRLNQEKKNLCSYNKDTLNRLINYKKTNLNNIVKKLYEGIS